MADWDRRTTQQLAKQREAAVRTQVVDAVGPFSPYWRARFKTLGRTAAATATVEALSELPAVGERDVCPDGDPAGAAALVLQAGEAGFALHAQGPVLRRALTRRLARPGSYRAIVEADTRPTSFVWAGLGMRYPVASTRSDLDLVARAGARAWQVLGLSGADVVVSGLSTHLTASVQALQYGALAAGSPLLAPGEGVEELLAGLRLVPATVLALPSVTAASTLNDLAEAGAPLAALTTLLLIGASADDRRAEVRAALDRTGVADGCLVLTAHVPDGHRLMWAECRESAGATGLHTYPDLELVQLVDPETGEGATNGSGPLEVVVTQLGFRGTALLRWRTGDTAAALGEEPCGSCGRTVPRLTALWGGALVPPLALRTGARAVDVRGVAAALVGRPDIVDWRIVLGPSSRDGEDELLVHIVPPDAVDPAAVAVSVSRDIRAAAGLLPSQVVVSTDGTLPSAGHPVSRRVLSR